MFLQKRFLQKRVYIAFLSAMVAADYSSVFVFPVGLCKWKNVRPILTITFKSVLRVLKSI